MALSDQLTELAARTKKLEDAAAANKQKIQSSVDKTQADAQV